MSRKIRNNNEKALKKLLSFNGKNQDVQDYLSAAKDALAENDLLNFEICLKKAVVKSEKNHLLLRKFASENNNTYTKDFEANFFSQTIKQYPNRKRN